MTAIEQAPETAAAASVAPCQVCGNSDWEILLRDGPVSVRACKSCGFAERDPMTDPRTRPHEDEGYGSTADAYIHKKEKKLRRLRRRMKALDAMARRHGAWPADRPGRFLDIGCNAGFMVECARDLGWEAHGVEADADAVAYARRHYPANTYHVGFVEDFAPEGLTFDAAYCSEVIEHAPDVNGFAARLAALLSPGGIIYLTTPDLGHWRRPKDIAAWDAYCEAHVVHFSVGNLTKLLEKHGLRVLKRRPGLKPGIKLFAQRTV